MVDDRVEYISEMSREITSAAETFKQNHPACG